MKNVSEEYGLIMNLSNTAHDHQKNCVTNCSVSLGQLKQAAIYIHRAMIAKGQPAEDILEASILISKMPIT